MFGWKAMRDETRSACEMLSGQREKIDYLKKLANDRLKEIEELKRTVYSMEQKIRSYEAAEPGDKVVKVLDIKSCARCGEDHGTILFEKLTRPLDAGQHIFGWWAPCPVNGQPIVMQVTELRPGPTGGSW